MLQDRHHHTRQRKQPTYRPRPPTTPGRGSSAPHGHGSLPRAGTRWPRQPRAPHCCRPPGSPNRWKSSGDTSSSLPLGLGPGRDAGKAGLPQGPTPRAPGPPRKHAGQAEWARRVSLAPPRPGGRGLRRPARQPRHRTSALSAPRPAREQSLQCQQPRLCRWGNGPPPACGQARRRRPWPYWTARLHSCSEAVPPAPPAGGPARQRRSSRCCAA